MAAHFCMPCVFFGKFMFPEDRPSPIFSTFSGVINAVGTVWAIVVMSDGSCSSVTRTWSILGLINCLANIAFAFYIYIRFAQKVREGSDAGSAAYKLFLYDWGVCVYILFAVWLIVFMVLAGQRRSDAAPGDKCASFLGSLILILVLYFAIGCFLIFVSLVTECCRKPSWQRQQQQQQQQGERRQPPVVAYRPTQPPPPPPAPAQQQQQHRSAYPSPQYSPEQQPQQRGQVYGIPLHGSGAATPPPPVNPHYSGGGGGSAGGGAGGGGISGVLRGIFGSGNSSGSGAEQRHHAGSHSQV